MEGSGAGSDYIGWVDWPRSYDEEEYDRIKTASAYVREQADVLVVIGIGGSYLGARAVIEALQHSFSQSLSKAKRGAPQVVFAGYNLSGSYLADLMDYLEDKSVMVNVISKSGTTTEPAVAFRIFRQYIVDRYGYDEARTRIFVTTDRQKGALKALATEEGYETFVVPDEIGGRYSVLSAVGLFPIACAGIDIDELMAGAEAERSLLAGQADQDNKACQYAAVRNCLLRKGFDTEIMVNYEPALHYFTEWWKQLYGESEGKDGRGLLPHGVDFTSDLHSMGQFIQDGRRGLIETVLRINEPRRTVEVPEDEEDGDGLNYLAGRDMLQVNDKAIDGTILAHVDGGVPNMQVTLDKISAYTLGELIYFFEYACGVSGYLNAINPFDQEGVEAYKKNMFALLGKPGYEALGAELNKRLEG